MNAINNNGWGITLQKGWLLLMFLLFLFLFLLLLLVMMRFDSKVELVFIWCYTIYKRSHILLPPLLMLMLRFTWVTEYFFDLIRWAIPIKCELLTVRPAPVFLIYIYIILIHCRSHACAMEGSRSCRMEGGKLTTHTHITFTILYYINSQ